MQVQSPLFRYPWKMKANPFQDLPASDQRNVLSLKDFIDFKSAPLQADADQRVAVENKAGEFYFSVSSNSLRISVALTPLSFISLRIPSVSALKA